MVQKQAKKEELLKELYVFGIRSSNNNLMLSFSLIRQRELSKSTVREVAERLGSKSPNAYAQYERGKMRITLDQFTQLDTRHLFFHRLLLPQRSLSPCFHNQESESQHLSARQVHKTGWDLDSGNHLLGASLPSLHEIL